MAHKLKVVPRPHFNKDGKLSKSKKDYVLIDRTRAGSKEVAVVSSKGAAEVAKTKYRDEIVSRHIDKHPRDKHFLWKVFKTGASR